MFGPSFALLAINYNYIALTTVVKSYCNNTIHGHPNPLCGNRLHMLIWRKCNPCRSALPIAGSLPSQVTKYVPLDKIFLPIFFQHCQNLHSAWGICTSMDYQA